jgi:hypothetical protein
VPNYESMHQLTVRLGRFLSRCYSSDLSRVSVAAGAAIAMLSLVAAFAEAQPLGSARIIARHSSATRLSAPHAHALVRNARRAAIRRRKKRSSAEHPAPGPTASASSTRPLEFGIYPGGALGSVSGTGPAKPEIPSTRLAAVKALAPAGQPFVVHVYAAFTGPGGASADAQLGAQVAQYSAAGLVSEPVLTYRPADGGSSADVSAFAAFAQAAVRAFGPDPQVRYLQVTNEANVGGAPNASDGYYAGAADALIQGVEAAKAASQSGGFGQLEVGFNWAYSTDAAEAAFWTHLAQAGPAFSSAVDWVGLDVYPGTWGPPLSGDLASGTTAAITSSISALRQHMTAAGIPPAAPIHISENGYPTGAERTDAMQVEALKATIGAIASIARAYNVTDYRYFDLRDADSSSSNFENRYGLMTDSYTPKPAYTEYAALVKRYG